MPRVTYTASEYTDMILIYGVCRGNVALALRTYRERDRSSNFFKEETYIFTLRLKDYPVHQEGDREGESDLSQYAKEEHEQNMNHKEDLHYQKLQYKKKNYELVLEKCKY